MKKKSINKNIIIAIIIVILVVITIFSNIKSKKERRNDLLNFAKDSIIGSSIVDISVNDSNNNKFDVLVKLNNQSMHLFECGVSAYSNTYMLLSKLENEMKNDINSISYECQENGEIKNYIDYNNFYELESQDLNKNIIIMNQKKELINTTLEIEETKYSTFYKESCKTYDYKTLDSSNNEHKGENIKLTGKVLEIKQDRKDALSLIINITNNKDGKYTDSVYIYNDSLYSEFENIKKNDIINIYGILVEPYNVSNDVNNSKTIPNVFVKYIEKK